MSVVQRWLYAWLMQSEMRCSSTLKRAVFLSACLSIGASHWSEIPAYQSQITAKFQPNERWKHLLKCTFECFYTNVKLMLKWKPTLVLNSGMTGRSSTGNGFELCVCPSCHTPFVFWSGTHAGWSPRRCVQRVTWFKDLSPLSVLRACSERAQPMRDEAPCYSDTAGFWVIYNTCESDQMQIVHADD